MAFFPGQPW